MSIQIDNTRKAYAAFAAGDIPALMETIAADCVWHVGGQSQLAGTYVGHEQIIGYFGRLLTITDGTFAVKLVDVTELPGTGQLVALAETSGTRGSTSAQVRMVQLGRANEAGQLMECWWFSEDQAAQDALMGPAEITLPAAATERAHA